MSARTALLAAVAGLTAAGCGTSPAATVRAKVEQFAGAVRSRDYRTICVQVLAPALVRHLTANGITCEQALGVGFSHVQDPTLSIGKVTITGSSASVIALTVAHNQQASIDTIGLSRTGSGWRITSLRAL